jgi:excisionase family DNA binding protein
MEQLLTTEQVAARLQVTETSILRWIKAGTIKGTKLPGNAGYRVSQADLDAYLESRKVTA